jgi:hypothetical protein
MRAKLRNEPLKDVNTSQILELKPYKGGGIFLKAGANPFINKSELWGV